MRCTSAIQWGARAVAVGLALLALTGQVELGEPFDRPVVRAPQGPLWTTWRRLQQEMSEEQTVVARCRAEPAACPSPAALKFIAIVDEGKDSQGLIRAGRINRAANFAIVADKTLPPDGIASQWTSPLRALAAGHGDCKHYAVLKYAALTEAGVAPEDLRIVLAVLKTSGIGHAAVALREAGHWYILDSNSLAVVDSRERSDFLPQFLFDRRGVWQYPQPAPQVADSACGLPTG